MQNRLKCLAAHVLCLAKCVNRNISPICNKACKSRHLEPRSCHRLPGISPSWRDGLPYKQRVLKTITDGVAFLDSSLADAIRRAHNIDFQLNQGVDRTLSNILQEMTSSTLGSPTPPPRSPSPPLRSLTPPQSAVTDEHLPGGCGGL